jgi:hypothetical protein
MLLKNAQRASGSGCATEGRTAIPVHFHCCVIDGVFAAGIGGQAHFAFDPLRTVPVRPAVDRLVRLARASAAAGGRQARIVEAVEDPRPRGGCLHCYPLRRNLSSSLRSRLRFGSDG